MPHATVRADARNLPTLDRRLFIAAGSASAVFGALRSAVAAPSADARIFELVEEGRYQWSQILPWLGKAEDLVANPGADEELDRVHDAYNDAFWEMLNTTPQTAAGVRAQLEWVKRDCEGISLPDEHVEALVASLLDSPVLRA